MGELLLESMDVSLERIVRDCLSRRSLLLPDMLLSFTVDLSSSIVVS